MMDARASRVTSSCSVSQEGSAVENELTCIVAALPDIVLTALPDGSVDFLNHRWYDYTGIRDHNAFGQGRQAAIHPADLTDLLDRWRAVLASCERRHMQARVRRFDGEYP